MALRLALLAGATVLLSGCLAAPAQTSVAGQEQRGFLSALRVPGTQVAGPLTAAPLKQVSLAGGAIVVRAPDGYCIDPETIEDRRTRSFAVVASCRILSGGHAGGSVPPMLVTVTVGIAGPGAAVPSPEDIADGAGVALLRGTLRDGVSVAQLASGGDQVLDNGDTRYWRAAFEVGVRQVGLALYAPEGSEMAATDGGAFLTGAARAIRRASPEPGAARPQPAAGDTGAQPSGTAIEQRDEGQAGADANDPAAAATGAPAPRPRGLGAAIGNLFGGKVLQ